jgi:hypothetical protein
MAARNCPWTSPRTIFVRTTNKKVAAPEETATLVSGNCFILTLEEEPPCHSKRSQGRAEEHYSRPTIGCRNSTGAAEHVYVRKGSSAGYLQDKIIVSPLVLGNRVKENQVTRTILCKEPADHVSWVHGEVNLNLKMSGDGIEGQIGERKGAERVGNRFIARRLDDAHFRIRMPRKVPERGQLGALAVVCQGLGNWSCEGGVRQRGHPRAEHSDY